VNFLMNNQKAVEGPPSRQCVGWTFMSTNPVNRCVKNGGHKCPPYEAFRDFFRDDERFNDLVRTYDGGHECPPYEVTQ
jgi:hypothetical protein